MPTVQALRRMIWRGCLSRGAGRHRRQRGVYSSLLALVLPLFIGAMGLGIDMSHYWWVRGQLQNAADAAAFAGAQELNSTAPRRARATSIASTYAQQHRVNGAAVTSTDVTENETGRWSFSDKKFVSSSVTDASANAIRVTVQRADVPNFFVRVLSGALASQTISASAVAVAGGTGEIPCGFPTAIASCQLQHTSSGTLICPTNLSFQNGAQSVGLTHTDGSSPVNGSNTAPFFANALNPGECTQKMKVGQTVYLQNGNDLARSSVDAINAVTNDGANPVSVMVPVVDMACGTSGPKYNQSANVVGFIKMSLVGARWTDASPAAVAAACPTLGAKNICVAADCGTIAGTPGGGTIEIAANRIYLVR